MAKAVTLKNANDEEVYPVTDISLVNGDINGARIVNASVGSDKLTPNAVWGENIKDGVITQEKFNLDEMPAGKVTAWSSSAITATTNRQIASETITTTKPVRLMLFIYGVLKTSRYTSHVEVRVDGNVALNTGTNITSFIPVCGNAVVELAAGTHTISYWLGGQDSGTTATLSSYVDNYISWWCV